MNDNNCFDHRFDSGGIKYGFCKLMVEYAKKIGATAITYVKEDHEHGEDQE